MTLEQVGQFMVSVLVTLCGASTLPKSISRAYNTSRTSARSVPSMKLSGHRPAVKSTPKSDSQAASKASRPGTRSFSSTENTIQSHRLPMHTDPAQGSKGVLCCPTVATVTAWWSVHPLALLNMYRRTSKMASCRRTGHIASLIVGLSMCLLRQVLSSSSI